MTMLILKIALAAAMVFAGVMHFMLPKAFARIVPQSLPAPMRLVQISGVFEILGGVGLMVPATQVFAAWGLIALFIAVFPANVSQAMRRIPFGKAPLWVTWARLPFQAVLIAWAWLFTH